MSGVTPVVDTLLANTLAQRVDLLPQKPGVQLSEPTAVSGVDQAGNDVRLPSRAAAERELGAGALPSGNAVLLSSFSNIALSVTARAISEILGGTQHDASSAIPIRGRAPLLPLTPGSAGVPPASHLLASTLARTVAESGLFYESHLLQYATGHRTLAQLEQEPQARLKDDASSTVNAEIHPDAIKIVRQQLELLAMPVFRWQGEAWPGTPMEWDLSQQPRDQQNDQAAAPAPAWSSCLKLTLPSLGAVELRLSMVDKNIQATILANDDARVSSMRHQIDDLRESLVASGLEVAMLQIKCKHHR